MEKILLWKNFCIYFCCDSEAKKRISSSNSVDMRDNSEDIATVGKILSDMISNAR